jgi:putative membrane protein
MDRSTPETRRALALALAVPALLLAAACAKGGGEDDAAAPADTSAAVSAPLPPPTSPEAATATVTDPQIAAIVVAANAVDSAAGELAKTKGSNQQVKDFGNMMVTDHAGVNRQAVDLVTRLGVTPEQNPTSQSLTQGGEQNVQRLQGLSGAEFDRAYIDNEVQYHQTVLDAIDQTLIPSARNAELRSLLQTVRPAVQAHLDRARQIQGSLQGS